MFTFETSDQKEVRRFRIAQFNGRTATARSAGSTVTGHVRSIVESKSSVPAAWTITIIPEEPKASTPRAAAGASRRAFRGRFLRAAIARCGTRALDRASTRDSAIRLRERHRACVARVTLGAVAAQFRII